MPYRREKRKEFTDLQKAKIFARDKALCCFSGISLWILDHGAAPTWQIDWVDHIKPIARGGNSEIENGICSSYFFNSKKKDNSNDNKYFFKEGKPTEYYYWVYGNIKPEIVNHFIKFKDLKYPDWYFNRTLYRLMLLLEFLHDPYKIGTKVKRVRGVKYYSQSAFKILEEWRKIIIQENIKNLSERGLVPNKPDIDQKIMMKIISAKNSEDIIEIATELLPYYKSNSIAISNLSKISKPQNIQEYLMSIKKDEHLTERIKLMMCTNIKAIEKMQ